MRKERHLSTIDYLLIGVFFETQCILAAYKRKKTVTKNDPFLRCVPDKHYIGDRT